VQGAEYRVCPCVSVNPRIRDPAKGVGCRVYTYISPNPGFRTYNPSPKTLNNLYTLKGNSGGNAVQNEKGFVSIQPASVAPRVLPSRPASTCRVIDACCSPARCRSNQVGGCVGFRV